MKSIRPDVVIVSTANLDPKHDAISDYKRHTSRVYLTRVDGDINVRMWDDGDLDLYDSKGRRLVRLADPS